MSAAPTVRGPDVRVELAPASNVGSDAASAGPPAASAKLMLMLLRAEGPVLVRV